MEIEFQASHSHWVCMQHIHPYCIYFLEYVECFPILKLLYFFTITSIRDDVINVALNTIRRKATLDRLIQLILRLSIIVHLIIKIRPTINLHISSFCMSPTLGL